MSVIDITEQLRINSCRYAHESPDEAASRRIRIELLAADAIDRLRSDLEQAKNQVEKLSTAIRKTSFLYDEYSRDPIDNDWNPVEKSIFEARSLAVPSTECQR